MKFQICVIILFSLNLLACQQAKDKDKKQLLLENLNIHDFNPSQYVEENDVDKKKKKEKDKKKKDDK